jgi:ferredoxin
VRIQVDPDRCQGHARCYGLAPTLFEVDEYGLSSVVGDGTVPPELEGAARLAIANCPEYAVTECTDDTALTDDTATTHRTGG